MPLSFQYGDITKIKVDAIVNAANESLLGGSGVDGAIHNAEGPALLEECRTLNGCKTGEAKMTGGYNLPAKHVIHTVGPVWFGGDRNEEQLLRSCYRNSIKIAIENKFESLAFPLISAGAYGYPKEEAFFVACDEISKNIAGEDIEVIIVLFAKPGLAKSIDEYTDTERIRRNAARQQYGGFYDNAPERNSAPVCYSMAMPQREAKEEKPAKKSPLPKLTRKKIKAEKKSAPCPDKDNSFIPEAECIREMPDSAPLPADPYITGSAVPFDFSTADESFSDLLFKMIDEKGLSDPECYKRANISRKLFSKIRCDKDYRPEKKTVLAFAVALELNMDETEMLLRKAGFAFSDWSKFDIIVSYYISNGIYNIFEINEALFEHDQILLGSSVR